MSFRRRYDEKVVNSKLEISNFRDKKLRMYRVGHLTFGISTTGYFEFERCNNIYDVSEI